MGIPFKEVGKGNLFSLAKYRALREAEAATAENGAVVTAISGQTDYPSWMTKPRNIKALTPWRIVPSFEDRAAIYDAENNFLFIERSDLVHRIVEAINEVEGRIAT